MSGEAVLQAIAKGKVQEVSSLLRNNNQLINFKEPDRLDTILMFSIWKEAYDIAAVIAQMGADVNLANKAGFTPLHRSCYQQHTPIWFVELLLKLGAILDVAAGPNLESALHVACGRNNNKVALFLIKKGADVSFKSKDGKAPLEIWCDFINKTPPSLCEEVESIISKMTTNISSARMNTATRALDPYHNANVSMSQKLKAMETDRIARNQKLEPFFYFAASLLVSEHTSKKGAGKQWTVALQELRGIILITCTTGVFT